MNKYYLQCYINIILINIYIHIFKKSKVIPIYKSGNCNDLNNYRPKYLVIQFSKI